MCNIVNDFIKAISYGEKDKALTTVTFAREGNISMKTFASLILEKVRIALLIKNAPSLAEKLKEQVSEDDWKVLEAVSKDDKSKLNSGVLQELLIAYDATGRAYIESLPIEMAVIAICK